MADRAFRKSTRTMADSVARLPEFAEDHLRDASVTQVQVETLDDSVEYEPYEWTRAFYRAMGSASSSVS